MSWFNVCSFILGLGLLGFGLWVLIVAARWQRRERREGKAVESTAPTTAASVEVLGALAVPDTAPIWLAFNLILDIAERETIENARRMSFDPNKCMAAVNAGDGINLVRIKLREAREGALKSDVGSRKSEV